MSDFGGKLHLSPGQFQLGYEFQFGSSSDLPIHSWRECKDFDGTAHKESDVEVGGSS